MDEAERCGGRIPPPPPPPPPERGARREPPPPIARAMVAAAENGESPYKIIHIKLWFGLKEECQSLPAYEFPLFPLI